MDNLTSPPITNLPCPPALGRHRRPISVPLSVSVPHDWSSGNPHLCTMVKTTAAAKRLGLGRYGESLRRTAGIELHIMDLSSTVDRSQPALLLQRASIEGGPHQTNHTVKHSPITPRPTAPTRVLCVDDNADMLEMMQMLIDAEPMMQCVGRLDSADQLIQTVLSLDPPPEIIVLDATMRGKDPLTVLRKMVDESMAVRTIVYSGYDDVAFVNRVRKAGAWGFVSKQDEPDAILRAVREVAAGKASWPNLPK